MLLPTILLLSAPANATLIDLRACFEATAKKRGSASPITCIIDKDLPLDPELTASSFRCPVGYEPDNAPKVSCEPGAPRAPFGCIRFADGKDHVFIDTLKGYGSAGKLDGMEIQVVASKQTYYGHLVGTNLYKTVAAVNLMNIDSGNAPLDISERGYSNAESMKMSCDKVPSGSGCLTFSDGYRMMTADPQLSGPTNFTVGGGTRIERHRGCKFDYYHLLGTKMVRVDPIVLPETAPPVPQPSASSLP